MTSAEQKLLEFIDQGRQLCIVLDGDDGLKDSFCWEIDAGQNGADFTKLEPEYAQAAQALIDDGKLQKKPEVHKYYHIKFSRINRVPETPS